MSKVAGSLILSLVLASAGSVLAGDAPKLKWTVNAGDTVTYMVTRESSMEGGQGGFKSSDEIEYKVKVDSASGGDLTLSVTYGAVKAKTEGGNTTWEFDSAKKEGDDESAKALREQLSKTITVKVSGGKIADVTGFPEMQAPQPGERGGFRGRRGMMIAGRFRLEGDLGLILGLAVQGKDLEAGKEYKVVREPPAEGKKSFRGGMFGRGESYVFKYQGEEQAGRGRAAAFALSAEPPPAGQGPGGMQSTAKAEGKALYSLRRGMLSRLQVTSERKTEGERNGQSFSFTSKSKTEIQRQMTAGAGRSAEKKSTDV